MRDFDVLLSKKRGIERALRASTIRIFLLNISPKLRISVVKVVKWKSKWVHFGLEWSKWAHFKLKLRISKLLSAFQTRSAFQMRNAQQKRWDSTGPKGLYYPDFFAQHFTKIAHFGSQSSQMEIEMSSFRTWVNQMSSFQTLIAHFKIAQRISKICVEKP